MIIEKLVDTVLTKLKEISRTETIIGKPVTLDNVTIIPVTKLSVGFGAGGGSKDEEKGTGEATGGGASIEPVAFFVIRGEKVELVTVKKDGTGISKFLELVPKIMESVKDFKSDSGKKSSKKEGKEK